MLVTKRNGSTEPVQINKITRRVESTSVPRLTSKFH